jgi:hypothetical protein
MIITIKLSFRLLIQRLDILCMKIRMRFYEHFKHKYVFIQSYYQLHALIY